MNRGKIYYQLIPEKILNDLDENSARLTINALKYGFHNLLFPVLYEGTIQSVQDKKSGLASKSMQRAKTHDMVVTLRRASLYR